VNWQVFFFLTCSLCGFYGGLLFPFAAVFPWQAVSVCEFVCQAGLVASWRPHVGDSMSVHVLISSAPWALLKCKRTNTSLCQTSTSWSKATFS
jgi:hypothetical protein